MILSPSHWLRLWERLVEPDVSLPSPEARRTARVLATLLLVVLPISLIDLITALTRMQAVIESTAAFVLLVLAYGLSRTRYYRAGSVLAIATLYLFPIIVSLSNSGDTLFFVKYLLLSVLFARLFGNPYVIALIVLALVAAVAAQMLFPDSPFAALSISPDVVLIALAIIVLVPRDGLYQQTDERFRVLSSLMGDYAYALRVNPDHTTETKWMAGAVEAITGYTIEEAAAFNEQVLVYEDDKPIFQKRLQKLNQGESDISEYRIVTKSGEIRWLRDYGYGLWDEREGRVVAHFGAAQDITERKQAELALRESEARFRAIAESNVVAIIITRLSDNSIVFCNQQAARLLGTTPDVVMQMKGRDFSVDPEASREFTEEVIAKGSIYNRERRIKKVTGEEIWINQSVRTLMLDGEMMRMNAFTEITERKATELALEQSRKKYESLVNTIDGVVWEVNIETQTTTFVSRRVESLLGYPVQRFYDEPSLWNDCIHPEDANNAIKTASEAVAAGRSFQQEYRMIAADGHIVWIHDIVTVIVENGKPVRMRGLALNISESRTAQASEQEQRRMSEALRETTAAISTTLDLDDVLDRILTQLALVTPVRSVDIMLIEDGTARIVRSMGYGEHEADMVNVRLVVEDTPSLRYMVETGQPIIIPDTRLDPNWIVVEPSGWIRSALGAPIRLEWQTIGFLNVTSDMPNTFTEEHAAHLQAFANQVAIAVRNARLYERVRRYAEDLESLVAQRTAELEMERRRIQIILDGNGEGIFYTEGMEIRYANAALCRLLGYEQGELIGKSVWSILNDKPTAEDQKQIDGIRQNLRKDGIWRGEIHARRKDGSLLDCGYTISVIGDKDEKPLRTVTIVRDISAEKLLQAQKSRFVAHASHELRTPITNMKTRLYLLRRRPQDLEYHMGVLEEVTDRMKKLVEDLLDISRLERGAIPLSRELLHVQPVVEGAVEVQRPEAERKNQSLTLEMPTIPCYIHADAGRLTQVITNLLTNAINYTPEGGSIRVVVEADEANNCVMIHVKDTGVGIDPDNLPHIFQPFFRVMSEVEGTGLGLSIAREIVELHEGTIEVKSTVGKGSTFTVRLGLVPQPATAN